MKHPHNSRHQLPNIGEQASVRYIVSSFCDAGQCVKVGMAQNGTIYVGGGALSDGTVQQYTVAEWDAFIKGVAAGEFTVERLDALRPLLKLLVSRDSWGAYQPMLKWF